MIDECGKDWRGGVEVRATGDLLGANCSRRIVHTF